MSPASPVRGVLAVAVTSLSLQLAAGPARADAITGWLAPAEPVAVGAALDGRVAAVRVTPGQAVAAGEVLVELDAGVWRAEGDAAQAHLKQVEGARDEAERERDRTQDLFDRTLISEHELNLSRNAYDAAVADYRRAQARLAEARQRVDWSRVTAPFAATVADLPAYPGQAVSNDCGVQTLVSLVPRDELRVLARTSADVRLYAGQNVELSIAGESLQAVVRSVRREGDSAWIEAGLRPPSGKALSPGQTVSVILP